jgi:2',3'-cyclic-nucleotide 2'-phosphodiesterase/3'-nucleotidase
MLRAKNVDLVIAISHGGIDTRAYSGTMENANWHLAAEPGIDVLLLGHSHSVFPDPGNPESRYNDLPEVDNTRGFLRGKPAVMGNFWGKSLGVIELGLVREGDHWKIDPAATHSEVRDIRRADGSSVAADPAVANAVADVHAATIDYVSTPIGDSNFAMTTYFADAGDVTALQPVNMAQRDYVRRYIDDNLPRFADVPVLSAAAPFKAGFGGPADYTDVPAGPLAIRNAADLYLYPNTLVAVRIDGAGLKAWLERSAARFNHIDPSRTEPQVLVSTKFPSYNFDVIQGDIRYAIDVTKPLGERIVDLRHAGEPVDADDPFIVVTNNYRAYGGGHFPGLDGGNIVVDAAVGNREVLIDWLREHPHLDRTRNGADRSWRFVPVKTAGPATLEGAAGKLGIARAAGLDFVHLLEDHGDGTATYAIDLGAAH